MPKEIANLLADAAESLEEAQREADEQNSLATSLMVKSVLRDVRELEDRFNKINDTQE